MPTGTRVRANNVFGLVTDNPLLGTSSTLNSNGLSNLPAISGTQHAIITLDPLRVNGAPEIVVVTNHNTLANVATISRGAYGTTARSHPQGTLWTHTPMNEDFIQVLTSITRPADPYNGEMIYETDTDTFSARAAGAVWQSAIPLGAWTSWAPTLTNLTLGNGTSIGAYAKVGRIVHFRYRFTLGTTSAVGTSPTISMPFAPSTAAYTGQDPAIGRCGYADFGIATYYGPFIFSSGSNAIFVVDNTAGTYVIGNSVTATVPFTFGNQDALFCWGTYEAAS